MRAGQSIRQPQGYRTLVPAPLPPDPPRAQDAEPSRLLLNSERALDRLDGVASILPIPDLFVAMYVRHEAVLSSQIEGTQSIPEAVLEFEAKAPSADQRKHVEGVVNYARAMNYGLERPTTLPRRLRFPRENGSAGPVKRTATEGDSRG